MKKFPNGVYSLYIIKIHEDCTASIEENILGTLQYEQFPNEIQSCIENLSNITNLNKKNSRDLEIFDRPIPTQQNVPTNWSQHIQNWLNSGKYNEEPTDSIYHLGNDEYKIENDPKDKQYKVPILPNSKMKLPSSCVYFERRYNVFNNESGDAFMFKYYIPNIEHPDLVNPKDWYLQEKTGLSCIIIYPERTIKGSQILYNIFDYTKFYSLCKYPITYPERFPNDKYTSLDTNYIEILKGRNNNEIQPYIILIDPLYEIGLSIRDNYGKLNMFKLNFIKPIPFGGYLDLRQIPSDFYMNIFNLV